MTYILARYFVSEDEMTFIQKPSSRPVRRLNNFEPIKPAFRERKFGSEFNRWELKLIKDFSFAKHSVIPTISGSVVYDHSIGRNRFLLIPAAHLPQDYVICECPPDLPVPSNLSSVTVKGKKAVFRDYWEIIVDNISPNNIKMPIEPEITFKEFQDQLFLQWGGIFSPFRELIAFEFVSSPPLLDLEQAGGLNVTVYDGTNRQEGRNFLRYLRSLLPRDIALGKSGSLTLPELATDQPLSPFSWRFKCFDADKPLNQRLMNFFDYRRSRRFSEVSVGLGTKRSQPKSIYDPPLTRVDQPTLLMDNAEMMKMSFDPSLEVTKYILTMQMQFPAIGKTQKDIGQTLELAGKKMINLAEKYAVPEAVQRHGLFDPNYYGKPQSILRLALASARSQGKDIIQDEFVMKIFDEIYLKNVETIMEEWDEIMTSKGVELASLNEYDRQVLKFITEKESKDYGVGLPVLEERFPDEIELRLSLDRLLSDKVSKIYEAKRNVFRSTPFVR